MLERSGKIHLIAATCLLLAACGDEVSHYRVPRADPGPAGGAARPQSAAEVAPPPRPASGALRWTLPNGWSEAPGGQMRYATLKPPVLGKIDGSVVVLPGAAGGELANVNRWRGQIGLPPIDERALSAARKVVQARAGPVKVYDFAAGGKTGSRLVAGIAESGGDTWFVKLSGDAGAVGAAREDFMKLLGSLRLE